MHPGDALFTPGEPVDVLATPAAAPWMKISEAVDYLRAVAPTRAVPIHQAIIEPNARGIYYGQALRDDRHRLPGARTRKRHGVLIRGSAAAF